MHSKFYQINKEYVYYYIKGLFLKAEVRSKHFQDEGYVAHIGPRSLSFQADFVIKSDGEVLKGGKLTKEAELSLVKHIELYSTNFRDITELTVEDINSLVKKHVVSVCLASEYFKLLGAFE